MTSAINAAQIQSQLKKLSELASSGTNTGVNTIGANKVNESGFGNLLTQAIDTVNAKQMESAKLASQVEYGDGGVSLVKAMIASQKAGVAFQATMQVRNRVVSAYQDIMNMPI